MLRPPPLGIELGVRETDHRGMSRLAVRAWRLASRFRTSTRGGVAMLVALSAPPVLLVALGAVQLQAVVSDKQTTQDIADAAALWGAQQLTVTPVGVDQRTIAFADAQLGGVKANATVTIAATRLGGASLKVSIDTHRPSFFMNLMPLGGFDTHAEAIAEGASISPLCVLIIGTGANDDIHLTDSSKLQGPACLVHSNHAVRADSAALIQADTVEAVTTASGAISPAASTGAPTIADPFAGLNYAYPLLPLCTGLLDFDISGSLAPGAHPFNYRIKSGQTLTLEPGAHYFCGDLELKDSASLIGNDVALIFRSGGDFITKDGANINLNGRKTGPLAGFVLLIDRARTSDFHINADPISNITGTLYSPNAKLVVDGSKKSGMSSAWTVLAADRFDATGGANLVINANYAGADVPVPSGVGNKVGTTHLTQ
jgi:hypothetical protein